MRTQASANYSFDYKGFLFELASFNSAINNYPATEIPQRRAVTTSKIKNSRDMFSRAAPVVVEVINNAEGIFG
jgi:hypothetical protein